MDLIEDGLLITRKSASNTQVSELIQREEKQVYTKLKEDISRSKQAGCGATLTNSDKVFSLRGLPP